MNLTFDYRMLLLAATLLLACGAAAAQGAISDAGVAAAATDDSVLLRWLLPDQTYPAGGFVITRTGGPETVETALPAPLPRDQAVGEGLVTDEEYDFLARVFDPAGLSSGPAADGTTGGAEFGRAIATLTTVARPDFARAMGTLFEDHEVDDGVAYIYTVTTAAGALVGTVRVTGGDVHEPEAPVGLRAGVENGAVALRWTRPAEGALVAAYDLFRLEDGGAVKLNAEPFILPLDESGDPALYLDESVEVGSSYTYGVEGIDLFGRRTPRSAPITVVVPDPRPLAVPEIVDGEVGDLSITLRWAPPRDERVRAVGVRRRTDPDGSAEQLTERLLPADATSYTDDDVQGGVTYFYTLVSVDGSGRISAESATWAERGHNPTPPSAPTALRVSEEADGLTLTWAAPPEQDVGSYRIYLSRQRNPGTEEFRYADATVETSYHLGMQPGSLSELHVLVRAVNTSDVEGPVSNVASGAPLDTVAPPAPRLVEAVGGQGQITVSWAGSADPDVQALRLHRAAAGGGYEPVQDGLAPNGLEWVDRTVQPGVVYRYVLEAVDASGNVSERSEPVVGRAFDLRRPEPVTGVRAFVGDGGVSVSWDALPGLGYVVERARAGGSDFLEISDLLDGASFTDARGAAGDSYRVFAIGAGGMIGAPSQDATAE